MRLQEAQLEVNDVELSDKQIHGLQHPSFPADWLELSNWGQIIYDQCEGSTLFERLKDYMKSHPQWKRVRNEVHDRAIDCCERCRRLPIGRIVHVSWDKCFDEDADDLLALCTSCYDFVRTKGKRGLDMLLPLEHHLRQL